MRFTVVVCTHNRASLLPQTLRTLESLAVPPGSEAEVITVDNASSDNTAEVISKCAETSRIPFRYVREDRLGHSAALNAGIRASSGDVIVNTDDDALLPSDWLVRIDEVIRRDDPDIIFGRVEPVWEEGGPPSWYTDRFRGHFALLDYGDKPFVVADVDHPFYGVNHSVRRRVYDRLGGYDEAAGGVGPKGAIGNDIDLFQRSLAAGLKIVYDPGVIVRHFIPSSRCSKADQRRRLSMTYEAHYHHLRSRPGGTPWLLGMPRWKYREALGHLASWAHSLLLGTEGDRFYYELRLRQFLGLWRQSARYVTADTGRLLAGARAE